MSYTALSTRRSPSPSSQHSTEDHVKLIKQGISKILVAVRTRPLSSKEAKYNRKPLTKILDNKVVILQDPSDSSRQPEQAFRTNRSKEKQYAFDYAFDEQSSQVEIFDNTTKILLNGVANGYNATVFAYGATGAGKTYTMLGSLQNPGIMMLTLQELYNTINSLLGQREFQVKLSYLEVYNELVKDLINVSPDILEIREDNIKGIVVAGLSEIYVTSPEEIMRTLEASNKNRTTESTGANETSSRSHAVLQITIENRDKAQGINSDVLVGKLSLIDLAGSERASKTQNRGLRLLEGANINRSLLSLGNCINALVEARGRACYIPYRDSKLTRLLKDSLGGNWRTVMIACISPSSSSYEDSLNTLKYANRAKNIKTHLKRNVLNVKYHISKYTKIIENLRTEILDLRDKLDNRQTSTLDSSFLPTLYNIEQYQIAITEHFKKEAKLRKKAHEHELEIHQLGFTLHSKQLELYGAQNQYGSASASSVIIESQVNEIKNRVTQLEYKSEQAAQKVHSIEDKRKSISKQWENTQISENDLAQLSLIVNQNILVLDNMDLKSKEIQNENLLQHKNDYISYLESQLKDKEQIIMQHENALKQYNVGMGKTFDNFESKSQTSRTPDIPLKPLPPMVTQSRIPKPKFKRYNDPKSLLSLSINESPSSSVLIRSKQEVGRRRIEYINRANREKQEKLRSVSVVSNKSDKVSSGYSRPLNPKFKNSPYLPSRSPLINRQTSYTQSKIREFIN